MDRNQELAEFEQPWKAPRELTRSTPREVRLTKGGIVLNVLVVAFLIGAAAAGIALGSKSTRETADRRLLDARGVPAEAAVTRLWHRTDKEKVPMVAYEFTYNGSVYRHSTSAPERVWKSLSKGSTVRIRVLPERPENNRPLDWAGDGPLPLFVAVLVVIFPVFGATVLLWTLRLQRHLLSEGKAAMGIIRKTRRSGHGKNVVTYAYKVPGGSIIQRKSGPVRKVLEPGAKVTIVYDPEKPSRSAIYPLELVRIDEMS
jgi:Protein of unknown function (DUF3592)